jgi:plasmid stabilization system protein ParE
VATFRFSNRALADLDAIAAYTIETWNVVQAERYLAEVEAASRRVAEIPQLGHRPKAHHFSMPSTMPSSAPPIVRAS